MLTKLFFPTVPGVRVERVWWEGQTLHLAAVTTRRAARCPLCGRRSKRMHSFYGRTIADLPCSGAVVTIHLRTRRFVCRVRWCRRKIFTERVPALVAPSARHTARLRTHLLRTGFALGGAPGARHATAAGMPVSRRTLLRLVRAAPSPEAGAVRVLGVDDWAHRRGQTYGTILVNLETHEVIDLLPDRTAETLALWLRQHPEVEIVSRDRGGAYAEGARQGAPQAVQVADRFHVLKNVTDSLERFLARKHASLRQAAHAVSAEQEVEGPVTSRPEAMCEPSPPAAPPRRLTRHEQDHQERRSRRLARYEEVLALHGQGSSLRAIARVTGLSPTTVRRYVQAEGFPECQPRRRRSLLLEPFVAYLQERWDAGCHNAKQLWSEIRQRGYRGGYTRVSDYLRSWRLRPGAGGPQQAGRAPTPPPARMYTVRQTVWLLLRPPEELTADEQTYLTHLYQACPQVYLAQALVQEFATVLREHDVNGLYDWLRRTETCPIRELQRVARGMWSDQRAIEAAVAMEWSNGQVEGQVNRLKLLKRGMYGRSHFDLLRQRVLHAA
jgi:transposase